MTSRHDFKAEYVLFDERTVSGELWSGTRKC